LSNRADEIRKQIEKRRKTKKIPVTSIKEMMEPNVYEDESMIFESPPPKQTHPLFKKETILLKILISAVMVLAVAIIFKSTNPMLHKTKSVISQTMKQEYQFATVANWYEDKFGKPLAILPIKPEKEQSATVNKQSYALPVSGKILTNFSADGRGVMIETKSDSAVKAMNGGTVIFAGKKKNIGNTVIIQHSDSSESWYGNLASIDVKEYDQVKTGKQVGTVKNEENGDKGEFYFALKKGNGFIDPIQVIKFE